uniref:Uncharacterized protein n=1 Tax=Arundo donax TaxID=35708 RepID=A0A0A8Y2X2_ARUDO
MDASPDLGSPISCLLLIAPCNCLSSLIPCALVARSNRRREATKATAEVLISVLAYPNKSRSETQWFVRLNEM